MRSNNGHPRGGILSQGDKVFCSAMPPPQGERKAKMKMIFFSAMCPHTKGRKIGSNFFFRRCVHTQRVDIDMKTPEEPLRSYAIRFSDSEVADIRDMTKVEAVAPAIRSIVLKEIEKYKANAVK
ncbi:MAG: hypothetical protein ACI4QT_01995 [Kiritimatiellia bacterium]